jgi:murein L,D-transpeptidase YcbB/YkuD
VQFVLDPNQGPHATFHFTEWVAHIDPTWFQPAAAEQLTSQQQAEIAGAVYHEARHAEQWYEMARLLAGLHGLNGQQIHDRTHIRLEVAEQAAAHPILECTTSNGPAFDWYESVYGAGAADRNATLNSLDNTDGTARWNDYRTDLPEESDAWDTGGTVARQWHRYESGGQTLTLPTLQAGDRDEEVRYLQQLLQWHGHYTGRALDADFGPLTREAVVAFQAAHGLTADGIVGEATWQALIP